VPANDVVSGGEINARRYRVRAEESIYNPADERSVTPYVQTYAVISGVDIKDHFGSCSRGLSSIYYQGHKEVPDLVRVALN
jgi:hypothetical protein